MMDFLSFLIGACAMAGSVWLIGRRFGFLGQSPGEYAHGPTFDIRAALNGSLLCDGVIYGPTGRVSSRFVAEFEAAWTGDTGIMHEHFRYDSGVTQHRTWHLSVDAAGGITAHADDLDGPGVGQQTGSGVRLAYRIKLPDSAGGHVLDVVDWMYLLENGVIINRSQFRKFGFKVGELVATMRPNPAQGTRQEAA